MARSMRIKPSRVARRLSRGIGVGRRHGADAAQPQFLHQPVLQHAVHLLDTTLGLARVGTQDVDAKFEKRPHELRVAAAFHVGTRVDPEMSALSGFGEQWNSQPT